MIGNLSLTTCISRLEVIWCTALAPGVMDSLYGRRHTVLLFTLHIYDHLLLDLSYTRDRLLSYHTVVRYVLEHTNWHLGKNRIIGSIGIIVMTINRIGYYVMGPNWGLLLALTINVNWGYSGMRHSSRRSILLIWSCLQDATPNKRDQKDTGKARDWNSMTHHGESWLWWGCRLAAAGGSWRRGGITLRPPPLPLRAWHPSPPLLMNKNYTS